MNSNQLLASESKNKEVKSICSPSLTGLHTSFDPKFVNIKAAEEIVKDGFNTTGYKSDSYIFRALTLQEFENGALLSASFKDDYKTFIIDLSRKIQHEYKCETASQKATAELAANAYCRTLYSQFMISQYLKIGSISEIGVKYIAVLSKELDRANRHYITAIQTLQMFNQAPLNITVRTQTANIGNQQLIQENNNVKPK